MELESVGIYLRRERELRKITLEEVSEQTRVPLNYLRAIESGHFEKIPGLTFVRGYLRAYALYIGLRPEEILLRFEDFLFRLSKPIEKTKSTPRKFLWPILFAFLFTAVAFTVLWLLKR